MSQLSALQLESSGTEGVLPPSPQNDMATGDGACVLDNNGGRLALIWDDRFGTTTPNNRYRVQPVMSNSVIAFVADMYSAPTIQSGLQIGVRTTMLMSPSGMTCEQMFTAIEMTQNLPALQYVPSMEQIATRVDQVYELGVHTSAITFESTGSAIAPGFAVEVPFPGFTSLHTSRPPEDVIWHHDSTNNTFYIWFTTGLMSSNDAITVTPGCPG